MPGFPEPNIRDARFRKLRKHERWQEVEAPCLEGPVADTHAHMQMLSDPALALARAQYHGVRFVANVCDICEDDEAAFAGIDRWCAHAAAVAQELCESDSRVESPEAGSTAETRSREEAGSYGTPLVRLIVGCHPHNAKDFDADAHARLLQRLRDPRVCALGEIGLDYHYDFSPRECQRETFARQLVIADEYRLPVSLHIREAHDEALSILRETGVPKAGAILHCFNMGTDVLMPFLDLGCHIAIGGPVTFANSNELREAVAFVPTDLLLTETDAPYMAPVPLRGTACEPAQTVFTAARLAEVRGVREGEERSKFLDALFGNALRLLNGRREL